MKHVLGVFIREVKHFVTSIVRNVIVSNIFEIKISSRSSPISADNRTGLSYFHQQLKSLITWLESKANITNYAYNLKYIEGSCETSKQSKITVLHGV